MKNSAYGMASSKPSTRSRTWIGRTVAVLLAVTATVPAYADSTTGTTITLQGRAIGGKTVTAHVSVTGKHLVTGPGRTVTGGNIEVTVNGLLVASIQAAYPYSHVIDAGCVQFDQYGNCLRVKYIADSTDVGVTISVPKGVSSFTVAARYTGDADSHGSATPGTAVRALQPGAIAGPIAVLLR